MDYSNSSESDWLSSSSSWYLLDLIYFWSTKKLLALCASVCGNLLEALLWGSLSAKVFLFGFFYTSSIILQYARNFAETLPLQITGSESCLLECLMCLQNAPAALHTSSARRIVPGRFYILQQLYRFSDEQRIWLRCHHLRRMPVVIVCVVGWMASYLLLPAKLIAPSL